MELGELDIIDDAFELKHQASGEVTYMPIMDEYPSAENQFDLMSNAEGGGVDPEMIAGAVTAVAGIASSISANKSQSKQELKNRCGRKPLFKKNRGTWDKCAEQFYLGDSGGVNKSMQQQPVYLPPPPTPQKGMSTGAIVGIVLGVVALGVGGFFLYKRSKG